MVWKAAQMKYERIFAMLTEIHQKNIMWKQLIWDPKHFFFPSINDILKSRKFFCEV